MTAPVRNIKEIEDDVSTLESDVAAIKHDVESLKASVADVHDTVVGTRHSLDGALLLIRADISELKEATEGLVDILQAITKRK